MKQDEIMEMARQAGFSGSVAKMWTEYFEAFAKLVEDFATAKEREGLVRIIEANIADERDACAKVCDDLDDDLPDGLAGWQYGEAIRTRS